MNDKKPWKNKVERDIIMHDDLRKSGLQGGHVIAEHLSLFSFIFGIPLLLIGLYAIVNMLLDWGFPINNATIIMVILVIIIGLISIFAGFTLRYNR